MGKLDSISIRNFKSIRELDLTLKPLNILIGANGVGKSNFLGVFKFLNQIVENNLQTYTATLGGANNILYYGRKKSEYLSFTSSFANNKDEFEFILNPTIEDTFVESNHLADNKLVDLFHWRIYHFHDTSDSAAVKQTGDLDDNMFLRPDARNLPAFLYRLQEKQPDHFKNIQDTVRLAAPFFDRFNLQPSRLNENKIRLEWKEKGSDDYFNAFSMSDGTLRFICLSTLLLQPELPSIILLDEPELGLHPAAINLLASMLSSASQKTQVIVATQSVTLVNQFEPENIIVMDREDGQSVFRHLDEMDISHWMDDFGIGDLWEKNVFGGRP